MTLFSTRNKKMQKVNQLMERAASAGMSVLVVGERGSGKENCARMIHEKSDRAEKPFVYVSADALTSQECCLDKYLADAEGGTLYIDNLCLLKDNIQKSLLSSLRGSCRDLRYITSCCKNIEPLVKKGEMSEELYHRLCVMQIRIPALRERKEDIPLLINEFANKYCERYNKQRTLSGDIYDKLATRLWPGNVAELENTIHYAVQQSRGEEITLDDLPVWSTSYYTSNTGESLHDELNRIALELIKTARLRGTYVVMEEYKKLVYPPLLRAALEITGNNKTHAAQFMGINRNTLKKLLREYEFEN